MESLKTPKTLIKKRVNSVGFVARQGFEKMMNLAS
jgi:hypothetical protein